ncbi:MAG: hypothetical protein HOO06_07485 [Bdellovibrionaceae bacterium]|nr:hypothetical protein [Pseudobdellovibrionaceae bacterium]
MRGLITPFKEDSLWNNAYKWADHMDGSGEDSSILKKVTNVGRTVLGGKRVVFNSKRLFYIEPTRLYTDATSVEKWREKGFTSVIDNGGPAQENSFLSLLVNNRKENPGPIVDGKSMYAFKEYQAEYSRQCPVDKPELEKHLSTRLYADKTPSGMPYGLPPISDDKIKTIELWEQAGAPMPSKVELKQKRVPQEEDKLVLEKWEEFLNSGKSERSMQAKKQRLVSRYLFEHLFYAHVYFDKDNGTKDFYKLVRSYNTCDKEIDPVNLRRPWNSLAGSKTSFRKNPKTGRLMMEISKNKGNYCFEKITSTLVHKTHITLLMDLNKIERVKDLFFRGAAGNWEVSKDFDEERSRLDDIASNPFIVFKDIPVKARYQYLLDDAQYHVMTFIRGPVCKGNTAVNSIDEQFYTFFVKPSSDYMGTLNKKKLGEVALLLDQPASAGSSLSIIEGLYKGKFRRWHWQDFREEKAKRKKEYSVEDIWTGIGANEVGGANTSSSLTVLRNYDSASVVKGMVGGTSKTVFVLDYSLFERLYYTLVAGFEPFGDAKHHLSSRIYMSMIKMEAEENYLRFLPKQVRQPMRDSWYVETSHKLGKISKKIYGEKSKVERRYPLVGMEIENGDDYATVLADVSLGEMESQEEKDIYFKKIRAEFAAKLKTRLASNYKDNINLDKSVHYNLSKQVVKPIQRIAQLEAQLQKVASLRKKQAPYVQFMPSLASIVVELPNGKAKIYTMTRQKEHYNVAWISSENDRRNIDEDSVYFYKGVLGSYPNMIFHTTLAKMQGFITGLKNMTTEKQYSDLVATYGRARARTDNEFWKSYDRLTEVMKNEDPVTAAYLDLNRYGINYKFVDDFKALQDQDLGVDLESDSY